MKRIFSFLVVLLAMGTMSVRAEETQSWAVDATGSFNVKMVYESSTDAKEVSLMSITDEGWKKDMVFPSKINATFENYDGKGHDLKGDFEYEIPYQIYEDYEAREVVETITFEEGIEVIPDYFFDKSTESFSSPTVLKTINIPASVKKIGDYAFRGHLNLENINIAKESKLTDIGNSAFEAAFEEDMMLGPSEYIYHSNITSLELPDGVELIGDMAFKGLVSLKSFTTPAMLMHVGVEAFDKAGIETLVFNSPILKATHSPFEKCPLKTVTIKGELVGEMYSAHVPEHAFESVGSSFDLTFLPDPKNTSIKWEGIVFAPYCFKNSSLKSIEFPHAFEKGASLPHALKFDTASLQGTSQLKSIDLSMPSNNNVEIMPFAFAYSGIQSVAFADNVRVIGDSAFFYSALKEVSIPQMYEYGTPEKEELYLELGEGAFADTRSMKKASLKSKFKHGGIEGILPAYLFAGSYIESIELPAATPFISAYAFYNTKLKEFDATSSLVYEIEHHAFAECSELEKVDLSTSNVKQIKEYTFYNDVKLSDLRLPANMEYIREYSLQGTALKSLDVDASHLDGFAIYDMPELESVRFVNKDLEFILADVLVDLPKLKSVDWGSKVKNLANGAIDNCPNYNHFVIGEGFETINPEAISDGQKPHIRQITLLSNKMENIAEEKNAPFRFMNIDTLIIDAAVTNIPKNLFSNITIQKNVELRKDLTINEDAFASSWLVNVNWHYSDIATFPMKKAGIADLSFSGLDAIADGLFAGVVSIENILLDGIKIIGKQAFKGVSTHNLTIPACVTEIKDEAFDEADIDNIVFENGTSLTIGANAFHRTSGSGTYTRISSFWPADNIPAATGAFDCDEIDEFLAVNAAARDAYKVAAGWKELKVKNWVGLTEYKYSFEIVGEITKRPIEDYRFSIYINDVLADESFIDDTNKAKLRFDSPCTGIAFDHWADGTKDKDECNIELTSDTVIKIYVTEERYDVKLSTKNRSTGATYGDAVKIYMATAEDPDNWVEQSEAKVNGCSWVKAKVVLTDPDHYWFNGWFNTSDAIVSDEKELPHLDEAATLIADVRANMYSINVQPQPACMECEDMIDHFLVNGKDEGTFFDEAHEFGEEFTVQVVGKKGSDWRYVLDSWDDELGNEVTVDNPYTFTLTDNVTLRPNMKYANKYKVTATTSDVTFGKVTMIYDADDLVETDIFWEGANIELKAELKFEHAVFKKWNDDNTDMVRKVKVTKDFDYMAIFQLETFKVTFVDWDDKVLSEQNVPYGEAAIAPSNPEREGYTFIGWDKTFSNVTGPMTIKAEYEENLPEGIDNTDAALETRKVLRNGQILIIQGERVYDVIGNRIR